ncbi:MAG: hypothetical protein QF609_10030 [Gammaproteobacteria bacterium]|jgi:hypothetical protein|nr:hypothetical protein [Gammaproteobacteria bacterium]
MARLSERGAKNRLAILVGLTFVIATSWFVMRGPTVELIGEETVNAKIVGVGRMTGEPSAEDNKRIGIVLVELPDGGRVRVFAPLSKVSVGATIAVKVKRFSDGSRRVTGAKGEDGS